MVESEILTSCPLTSTHAPRHVHTVHHPHQIKRDVNILRARQLGLGHRHPWLPGLSSSLTQAGVPYKELSEGFTLFAPVSAGLTAAPGRDARAHVVQVVGGDHGACGDPQGV